MSHCQEPELQKLQAAVEEYVRDSGDEDRLLVNAVLVFETTRFEDDGRQVYQTQGLILEPSTLAGALGVLTAQKKKLAKFINEADEDDE